jgi:ribonuclease HI
VIDYAICSKELFPKVKAFGVAMEPRIPKCDHAALILQLEIDFSLIGAPTVRCRKRKREDVVLPNETELDRLVIQTVQAGKDESKKTLQLFGPVYFDTNPVLAGICGVCKNQGKHTASGGAAVFFGDNSNLNRAVRIWGTPTKLRAEVVALLVAVRAAPRTKTLHVLSRSDYAIKSVKYWAFCNEACGWKRANGDILKLVIQAIKIRSAPIHLIYIKKDEAHGHYSGAHKLAEHAALTLPRATALPYQDPGPIRPFTREPIQVEKVTANIPDDSGDSAAPLPPQRPPFLTAHRGRQRLHEIKERNRKNILEAP